MNSIKNKKLSSIFYIEIAEILHKEFNKNYNDVKKNKEGFLVTLIKVCIFYEMNLIMGYIAIYPFLDRNILRKIRLKSGFYRKLLSKRLRYRVKKIPKLDFRLDRSLELMEMEKKEKKFLSKF
ncbi:ribosome-binding factor A [Blattabacterium cuenoti]|uniref:ribosome-binding factor A n=1 Tax=Blattabacterium cuenoti TaxID=1653831 RepID=UPI001EEC8BC8|nr:ribosome-binding factor A [Blattabacterium cuenoti]